MSFKRELLRSIPYYVWAQHILPYTYSPQSQDILNDLRNYKTSYSEALQTYTPFGNRADRQLFTPLNSYNGTPSASLDGVSIEI